MAAAPPPPASMLNQRFVIFSTQGKCVSYYCRECPTGQHLRLHTTHGWIQSMYGSNAGIFGMSLSGPPQSAPTRISDWRTFHDLAVY